MRGLDQFSPGEWARLVPARDALRQLRNDALLAWYRSRATPQLDGFLAGLRHLADTPVAAVVTFEQPWALDWQLEMAARHLRGLTLLVFDNSRSEAARGEIRAVCARRGVPYLGLPAYRTRHPNRSHGMAMGWVHANVIGALRPSVFAFLDHDLIPVRPFAGPAALQKQPVFGLLNAGRGAYWSLWAGYCFFRRDAVAGRRLNFLYDFSRGLDTGGRNWDPVYRHLERERLQFASRELLEVSLPGSKDASEVELIDGAWLHIGGISYSDSLERGFAFYRSLREWLAAGNDWDRLPKAGKPAAAGR